MENVKVTVWLSTYNQAPYVAQALDSILMQKTDFPYEIVAADDCSTDGTQEIILEYQKRYPEKIVTYFTPENIGGCKKLTNCIDLGLFRGEYLSYLEGDDYWLGEDRLQNLVDFLEVHPEYAAIAHQRNLVDEHGGYIGQDLPTHLLNKSFTIETFLEGWDYADFGTVFRNYFRTNATKYHELFWASRNVLDFQDMFIMQDFGPVYVTDSCFGVYRCARHAGATNYNSITSQSFRCMDHIRICTAIESFYQGKYSLAPMIQQEQRKLLTAVLEEHDEAQFLNATRFLNTQCIIRDCPEIIYLALRGKRKKTVLFAVQHLSLKELLICFVRMIPFSVKRLYEKMTGVSHERYGKRRGYTLQTDK